MCNVFINYAKKPIFRNYKISLLWSQSRKAKEYFALPLLNNFGIFLYQTAKKTSQWMSSCYHIRNVANLSSTWLTNQTSTGWNSGWELMLKTTFIQGFPYILKKWHVEFRCEHTYWCCSEANGIVFLGYNVKCNNFPLTWPGTGTCWVEMQSFLSNVIKQEEFIKK